MIKKKVKPFVEIYSKLLDSDIYSGNERIEFHNRHPIYKTLLKLEFEEAIHEYMKIKSQN